MAINILILLDLNCFPVTSDPSLQKKYLKWTQEYILSLVSKTASDKDSDEVDFSKILWSYKFFNSSKDVDYHGKKFEPFSITTFEAFEASSLAEYERFISTCNQQDCFEYNKSSCLSQALMRITSDMRWEEMPQISCKNLSNNNNTNNMVYTVLRVPRNDDDLLKFADKTDQFSSSPNSKDLLNTLLPKAFLKEFHVKYNIQLSFIDTWVLHKEENLSIGWDGVTYSRQVIKVLEYLNKGTVLQLQIPQPAPPGLPSYFILLKNSLRSASAVPSITTTPTNTLSEAQKVLQNQKQARDSSNAKSKFSYQNQDREQLNSSFSSVQSLSKSRNHNHGIPHHLHSALKFKESDKKSKSRRQGHIANLSKYDCKKTLGLAKPNGNAIDTSPDSSNSDDSPIIGRHRETSRSKFTQLTGPGNAHHHTTSSRSQRHRMKLFQSQREILHYTGMQSSRQRRISPTYSSMDNESILSDTLGLSANSRTAHLLGLATDRERKKWALAIKKEEEERWAIREERRHILGKFETLLAVMKTRLSIYMEKCNLRKVSDDYSLDEYLADLSMSIVKFKEQSLEDESLCILSLAQTIVQFIVEKLQQHRIVGKETRSYLEKTIYIPIPELRASVLKLKNDENELSHIFRYCQFQILVRMEASWLLPEEVNDTSDKLRDEVVDLLSLLAIYMKKHVDDFMANVVVQGYLETHSEMLIRLFRGLNMDPPRNLLLSVTPSKSVRSRSSYRGSIKSPFGSCESLFLPPSQTQLQYNRDSKSKDGSRKRVGAEDSFATTKNSARYASHLSVNNPKKLVMVPVRTAKKLPAGIKSPKVMSAGGRPTRVRRNLFEADKNSAGKSSQMCSRLSRSPSVAASGKSQSSLLSPRLKVLRSKRKLNLDDFDDDHKYGSNVGGTSPDMFSPSADSKIICPATPSYKPYNSAKKVKRGSSYRSSCENIVIGESPELPKAGFTKSFSQAVHSLSFYSTKSDKVKSRTWEKSGNKMLAAKIKRTVDSSSFMNSGLTLSDLEIFGGSLSSPDSKSMLGSSSLHTPNGKKQQNQSRNYLGSPCCSKSLNPNSEIQNVEIKQSNVNASIEALIMSKQPLALLKTTPKAIIETPKKISFNFDESLIKTPSHVSSSPRTPRSILKTPSRYENGGDNMGKCNKVIDFNATPDKCSGSIGSAQVFQPLVFEPQKLNSSPNNSDPESEAKALRNIDAIPQGGPRPEISSSDNSDSTSGNDEESGPNLPEKTDTTTGLKETVGATIQLPNSIQLVLQNLPPPEVLPNLAPNVFAPPQSFLDLLNNGPRSLTTYNQQELIAPIQPQVAHENCQAPVQSVVFEHHHTSIQSELVHEHHQTSVQSQVVHERHQTPVQPQVVHQNHQSQVYQHRTPFSEPCFFLSQSPISQFVELQQCGSQNFKPC